MLCFHRTRRERLRLSLARPLVFFCATLFIVSVILIDVSAQNPALIDEAIATYVDPIQGSSSIDLVRRALASNAQLAATRLEIDRARARLRQAGMRPNPSMDFEQQNGVLNSPGERT